MTTPDFSLREFDPMGLALPLADAARLDRLLSSLNPAVSVEVGSWAGLSASIISEYSAYLVCIDDWLGNQEDSSWASGGDPEAAFQTFCRNMSGRLLKYVFPCRGDSLLWASIWTIPIDFLYIDASHDYESVKADIEAGHPHVKPGGVIAGHDYGAHMGDPEFPGVCRAVDEFFPERHLEPESFVWSHEKPAVLPSIWRKRE